MNTIQKNWCSATVAVFMLSGCATTESPRELAKVTAANASRVQSAISEFANSSQEIARERADAIALLAARVEMARAEFDAYIASAKATAVMAGATKEPNYATIATEFQNLSEYLRLREERAQVKESEFRESVVAEYESLGKPPAEIGVVAKQLSTLAKEQSNKEQLDSLKQFVEIVLQNMKQGTSGTNVVGAETPTKSGVGSEASKKVSRLLEAL